MYIQVCAHICPLNVVVAVHKGKTSVCCAPLPPLSVGCRALRAEPGQDKTKTCPWEASPEREKCTATLSHSSPVPTQNLPNGASLIPNKGVCFSHLCFLTFSHLLYFFCQSAFFSLCQTKCLNFSTCCLFPTIVTASTKCLCMIFGNACLSLLSLLRWWRFLVPRSIPVRLLLLWLAIIDRVGWCARTMPLRPIPAAFTRC